MALEVCNTSCRLTRKVEENIFQATSASDGVLLGKRKGKK